jgi:hypothetical protein
MKHRGKPALLCESRKRETLPEKEGMRGHPKFFVIQMAISAWYNGRRSMPQPIGWGKLLWMWEGE